MSLYNKYDNWMRRKYGHRAVWLPGKLIKVGSILVKKDGGFVVVSDIESFGVNLNIVKLSDTLSYSCRSQGVRTYITQSNARVSNQSINVKAQAEIHVEFSKAQSYYLKTSQLLGSGLTNLLSISNTIISHGRWKHREYYLVYEIWEASDFTFLASHSSSSNVVLQGSGKEIIDFFNIGIGSNLVMTGQTDEILDLFGKKGPIAMKVTRIKRNGGLY